ncbi:MAG: diguanylate cyclase [Alphaproteobacteria bacterium]|nr:diguanylate cyclase [Alphaproteobacteria bacterium]
MEDRAISIKEDVSLLAHLPSDQISLLQIAIECIEDGFAVFNAEQYLVFCNQKFKELYSVFKVLGQSDLSLEKFLRVNITTGFYLSNEIYQNDIRQKFKNIEEQVKYSLKLYKHSRIPYLQRLKDHYWLEICNTPLPTGGIVSIHKDVTARKLTEEKLTYMTRHDFLTGLYNRSFLKHQLDEIIKQARKNQERFALIYLDLNQFKKINDTLGHKLGDDFLITIAGQISRTVRRGDFVARIGGDEFIVLLPTINSELEAFKVMTRLTNVIQGHFPTGHSEVKKLNYTLSAGMALYPDHGRTADALITYADAEMYKAKKQGIRIKFNDKLMNSAIMQDLSMLK